GANTELVLNLVAQGLGTVQGTVSRNGNPEAGARVEVVSGSFRATTLSDAVGRYVVDAVPEGTVAVTASVGTQSLAGTHSGRLLGDGSVLVLDVALRGSGSLSGFLRRPGGTLAGPVSRVTLQAGGQGGGMQTTVSAEDGQFGFGEVPAGTVSLRADVLGG